MARQAALLGRAERSTPGARRVAPKARGVDGESARRATMVPGHYAANVTAFLLILFSPFRLVCSIDPRRSPIRYAATPLHQLISGRNRVRTKIPLATVRGHKGSKEDGTHLPSGVLQPDCRNGHTSILESVCSLSSFCSAILITSSQWR